MCSVLMDFQYAAVNGEKWCSILLIKKSISDPHINICVGPCNTFVALKQFNLLRPNTLFWSNFIYYPQHIGLKQ